MILHRRIRLIGLALVLAFSSGCEKSPPKTPAQGTYGQIVAQPATNILPARPHQKIPDIPINGLMCIQTGLSPAALFSTKANSISFFTELANHGLGAPNHCAYSGRSGPRAFKNGDQLEPAHMEENWVLVWFAGARGWTNGDSPCVVYLQYRPRSMRLDTNGLHFQFDGPAGDIVLLPLYGSYRPPAKGGPLPTLFHNKKVETWKWAEVLTREPLMRVRYWASALREFPIYCEETFSVDRSTDTVTIRKRTEWRSIVDDWNTRHLKLNSIDSVLALAKNRNIPVKFSRPVMDLEMPTPSGSYVAAEGEEPISAAFAILHHINNASDSNDPMITAARDAYRRGDVDEYNYRCYLFSREFAKRAATNTYALGLSPTAKPAERLIPSAEPSLFILGIERETAGPISELIQRVKIEPGEWPQISLLPNGQTFGSVKTRPGSPPAKAERLLLNWNTEVLVFFD